MDCAGCAGRGITTNTDFGLDVVRDASGGRALRLLKCPDCGALFLYWDDYTYLVNGATEDEEWLRRLDGALVAEALAADDHGLRALRDRLA
jgi:uncharacterized C2H2 Zn-finger protein